MAKRGRLRREPEIVVSDNTIAFFVVPKSPGTAKAARPVLASYVREHKLRFWEAGERG